MLIKTDEIHKKSRKKAGNYEKLQIETRIGIAYNSTSMGTFKRRANESLWSVKRIVLLKWKIKIELS